MISGIGGEGTFTAAAIKSEREVKEQRDQGKHFTAMKIKHAPRNEIGNHPFIWCGMRVIIHKGVFMRKGLVHRRNTTLHNGEANFI